MSLQLIVFLVASLMIILHKGHFLLILAEAGIQLTCLASMELLAHSNTLKDSLHVLGSITSWCPCMILHYTKHLDHPTKFWACPVDRRRVGMGGGDLFKGNILLIRICENVDKGHVYCLTMLTLQPYIIIIYISKAREIISNQLFNSVGKLKNSKHLIIYRICYRHSVFKLWNDNEILKTISFTTAFFF